MPRWHEPLGRRFAVNAERMADIALEEPVIAAGRLSNWTRLREVGKGLLTVAVIDRQRFTGYLKPVDSERGLSDVVAGTLATHLGAPSAPCLMIRDVSELHLFSAAGLKDVRPGYRPRWFTGDPAAQGAGGQFLAFINNRDCLHNNYGYDRVGALILYDHEMMLSTLPGVAVETEDWMLRNRPLLPGTRRRVYDHAAAAMAERIGDVSEAKIATVVMDVAAALPDRSDRPEQAQLDRMVDGLRHRQEVLRVGPIRPRLRAVIAERLEDRRRFA